MGFLGEVVTWFATAEHWWGDAGILNRLYEHIQISVFTMAVALAVALLPAIALGHRKRGGNWVVTAVNLGRAIPSFGILALALPFTIELAKGIDIFGWEFSPIPSGLGFWPTFVALLALAIPPVFTNAFTGVREVDADTIEAARGMGLTERQILTRIELPMAMPIVLAATRVASVQVVATATLGALVAWGGLGRFIIDGFAQQDNVQVFAGSVLVALLAIATEVAFVLAERALVPRGIRVTTTTVRTSVAPGAPG
ncbi:MAG: ABC transporter permease [Actinobacteria bacterium]|nr:ABC transporter permease [Actinomycetota bacterium]